MLKVIGALMLLCGCSGIGLMQVTYMEKRIKTIRSLLCALEIMERELSFRMPLLEEILATAVRSTEDPTRSFLFSCENELKNTADKSFFDIWKDAANEQLACLKKCDLDHVFALGRVLGRYDSEGQRQAIGQAHSALKQSLSNAEYDRNSRGRVCKALSATAGALLVILLL